MRTGLIAKALSRRFDFTRLTGDLFARIARSPSYRAPSARDLHTLGAFRPPDEKSPLEAFGAKDLVIRDGEVVGMSLSGRSFISNGAELVRKVPLRELRLVAVQPFMGELAHCPQLVAIRRLHLSGNRIGVKGIRELANSPYLGDLRELNISGNDLGPEGTRVLSQAPWLTKLERLAIADNEIGCEELRLLLATVKNLTELDLSRNPLGREGGGAIAQRFDDRGERTHLVGAALRGGPTCGTRSRISAGQPRETSLPHVPLGSGRHGGRPLQGLAVSGCNLGPDGVRELLHGDFPDLQTLDLSFNRIGPDAAFALPPALTWLDLSFNDLGDTGIAALTANPPLATLTSLNLAANRISPAGLRQLAESGWLDSICDINLEINPIDEQRVGTITPSTPDS